MSSNAQSRHRVLIAGGGIAGVEALAALGELAADHVDLTLLSADDTFRIPALSVSDPFGRPVAPGYALAEICADHEAHFAHGTLVSVDAAARQARTEAGEILDFDSLLVAVGARPEPAFRHGVTFRGMQDADAVQALIRDVERGTVSHITFIVPSGVTWPLPAYELALMTAERAGSVGVHVGLTVVTSEKAPLAVFGERASTAVDELLHQAGIVVMVGRDTIDVRGDVVVTMPGSVEMIGQRAVAIPRLYGRSVAGLPTDDEGFLLVDDHCRVPGADGVFGAGDGTTVPVRLGALAAQQAGVAARGIAADAGAPVQPHPFRPELRAQLLTGTHTKYLRHALAGGGAGGDPAPSDVSPWWPPSKVAAPYLSRYLEQRVRA